MKTENNSEQYYQKKGSDAKKYGYCLLLQWESAKWERELKQEYKIDKKPLIDEKYDYVLDLLNSEQTTQKWNSILEEIKHEDPIYRIEKEIEKGNEGINIIKDKVDETKQIVEEGFGDNKKEHEKTQTGVENANQWINIIQQTLSEIHEVVVAQNNKQIKESVWFDVRDSVTFFTALSPGREDQLNKIADNIQQKMVVITGKSGVGKSELAIQYARSKYSQGSAIWINAKTPKAIKISFCELAEYKLKIKFKENEEAIKFLVQGVYEHFANKKSLFIFNNAEKYSAIEEFLPLCLPPNADKPWILITSTNSQRSEWASSRVEVETVELNSFNRPEAIEFVKKA